MDGRVGRGGDQVNTFVIHTTGLLNRFAALAERKLETIDKNISRVDIQLKLLESKLSRCA